MSKYPVQMPFKFQSDEIGIKENQLPFVRISLLTDNIVDETIEFFPNQAPDSYNECWYCYGDDELVYAGDTVGWVNGILSSRSYSGKYLLSQGIYSRVYWKEAQYLASTNYPLQWSTGADNKLRPHLPHYTMEPSQIILPYNVITIKRNIGLEGIIITNGTTATIEGNELTDIGKFVNAVDGMYINITSGTEIEEGSYKIISHNDDKVYLVNNPGDNSVGDVTYNVSGSFNVAQGINPSFDVPIGNSYPNLLKTNTKRKPTALNNTSKIWLKTGVNKYRLIVYGKYSKFTDKQVTAGGDYLEGTYTYIPYYEYNSEDEEWLGYYKLDSSTESTKNIPLSEATYNPSNVRLLINYMNNSGQNEVRKYKI